MDSGVNSGGISFLNGGPHYFIGHWKQQTPKEINEFWTEIKQMKSRRHLITAKSNADPGDNLIFGHSYVIMDQLQLKTGERLLLLRNPWGWEEFDGRWSDFDRLWTKEAKKQRGIPQRDDGLFYISVEDYVKHMDYTYVNYDTTDYYQDYFMMWDDPAKHNGNNFMCGSKCTQHTLYVKSSVRQTVSIGAHTYRY